ncbi:hypothetical protein Dimus_029176, partial [Dionaea muscipula]
PISSPPALPLAPSTRLWQGDAFLEGRVDRLRVSSARCARKKKKVDLLLPRSLVKKMQRATAEEDEFRVKVVNRRSSRLSSSIPSDFPCLGSDRVIGLSPINEEVVAIVDYLTTVSSLATKLTNDLSSSVDDTPVETPLVAVDGETGVELALQTEGALSPCPVGSALEEDLLAAEDGHLAKVVRGDDDLDASDTRHHLVSSPVSRFAAMAVTPSTVGPIGERRVSPVEGGAVRPQPTDGLGRLLLSPVVALPGMVEKSFTEGMLGMDVLMAVGDTPATSNCGRVGGGMSGGGGKLPMVVDGYPIGGEAPGRDQQQLAMSLMHTTHAAGSEGSAADVYRGGCQVQKGLVSGGMLPTVHVGDTGGDGGGVQSSRSFAHVVRPDRRADVELS